MSIWQCLAYLGPAVKIDFVRDIPGQVILHGQHFVQFAVVRFSPEVHLVAHLGELGRELNVALRISPPENASPHQI